MGMVDGDGDGGDGGDGGWRMEDGGWRMVMVDWWMVDGGLVDGGWSCWTRSTLREAILGGKSKTNKLHHLP